MNTDNVCRQRITVGEVGESLEKTWYSVFEVSPFIVDRGKLTSGLS